MTLPTVSPALDIKIVAEGNASSDQKTKKDLPELEVGAKSP